jgi:dTMP kinase
MAQHEHPLIVIEGLDGVGKTTAAKLLAEEIGAELLRNPPLELIEVRSVFERRPEHIKRRFFEFGNLVTNEKVVDIRTMRPVVVDRWWFSTRVAQLAHGVFKMDDEAAYTPPPEMLVPDVALLLSLDEDERRARIMARGEPLTEDEERMIVDDSFRERMLEGYRRLGVIEIDITHLSPTEVRDELLGWIPESLLDDGISHV